MAALLESIDARTRLVGTNKLEILLFSLGAEYNGHLLSRTPAMAKPQMSDTHGTC